MAFTLQLILSIRLANWFLLYGSVTTVNTVSMSYRRQRKCFEADRENNDIFASLVIVLEVN